MALNLNRDLHNLMLFELSRVFRRQNGLLPQEPQLLGLAVTGSVGAQHWGQSARPYDFYDLIGVLEMIGAHLRLQPFSVTAAPVPYCHPGRSALIGLGDDPIGVVGEIHPTVLAAFEIEPAVTLAEIDFDQWLAQGVSAAQYRQIPRFPSVTRDVSIIVDTAVQAGQIWQFHSQLLSGTLARGPPVRRLRRETSPGWAEKSHLCPHLSR